MFTLRSSSRVNRGVDVESTTFIREVTERARMRTKWDLEETLEGTSVVISSEIPSTLDLRSPLRASDAPYRVQPHQEDSSKSPSDP